MKRFATLALTLALGCFTTGAAQANDPDVIEIGYFNWSDARFTTNVVKYILEEKMDREVELILANPAAIYQGVGSGDIDFHVDAWLPKTHAQYFDKVARDVIDAGAIYEGARSGWVVPDYIPEDKLDSIDDLKNPDVMEKLNGRITGIDPGAGLMDSSREAMEIYGLGDYGYKLLTSSGPAMAAALKRAIQKQEWIVVTGWNPHWMFSVWDLRYLGDPKNVMTGIERADILTRHGFYQEAPVVYGMLDRITIPLDDVQSGMRRAEQTSYAQAAKEYVESHPHLVHYWVTGEMTN